ncbi:MAG: hypothetical protein HS114_16255 [Anaerolineales bacterium]|nr:hypothetical protein [Anaerolineales bacterium]
MTRHYRSINHIFFHLIDPEWGHHYPYQQPSPFAAMVILNGHEYLACQAHQPGELWN